MPKIAHIENLKPITRGDGRGGRVAGVQNLFTRQMKTAMALAAEASKHGNGTLVSYLTHIADEYPQTFAAMLARMIPQQAKIQHEGIHPSDIKLTTNMSLPEMIAAFEMKIKSDYVPASRIVQDDVEVEDE